MMRRLWRARPYWQCLKRPTIAHSSKLALSYRALIARRQYQDLHTQRSHHGPQSHRPLIKKASYATFKSSGNESGRGASMWLVGWLCAIALFAVDGMASPHRSDSSDEGRQRSSRNEDISVSSFRNEDMLFADDSLDDLAFRPPPPLSRVQIEDILTAEASTLHLYKSTGVVRNDIARVASNSPVEDMYSEGPLSRSEDLPFCLTWGIYDGHRGSQVCIILAEKLLNYVEMELLGLPRDSRASSPNTPFSVDNAIKRAFVRLDNDIIAPAASILKSGTASFAEKYATIKTSYAGSCVLLALWEPDSSTLRVACTGDSRAVLASRDSGAAWVAQDLSVDQNIHNPDEVARIKAEHPNEEQLISFGRMLGNDLTRSFGDGSAKIDKTTQLEAMISYNAPGVAPRVLTPPYLTAEPVITTTQLDPQSLHFMIMASDGLWDHMTSQQAVDLVVEWLKWNGRGRPDEPPGVNFPAFDFRRRNGKNGRWQVRPEWHTTQDSNAAVHLIRNAFGGRDNDTLGAVLSVEPPLSKMVRGDATVQVVFFGDGWGRRLPGHPREFPRDF